MILCFYFIDHWWHWLLFVYIALCTWYMYMAPVPKKQNSFQIQSITHLRHFIFEIFHKLYCYQLNLFTIFSIKAKNVKNNNTICHFLFLFQWHTFYQLFIFLSWITSSIFLYKNKPFIAIDMGHIDRGDSTNFENKYYMKTMNEPYWTRFVPYRRINRCYLHNVLIHLPLLYLLLSAHIGILTIQHPFFMWIETKFQCMPFNLPKCADETSHWSILSTTICFLFATIFAVKNAINKNDEKTTQSANKFHVNWKFIQKHMYSM